MLKGIENEIIKISIIKSPCPCWPLSGFSLVQGQEQKRQRNNKWEKCERDHVISCVTKSHLCVYPDEQEDREVRQGQPPENLIFWNLIGSWMAKSDSWWRHRVPLHTWTSETGSTYMDCCRSKCLGIFQITMLIHRQSGTFLKTKKNYNGIVIGHHNCLKEIMGHNFLHLSIQWLCHCRVLTLTDTENTKERKWERTQFLLWWGW